MKRWRRTSLSIFFLAIASILSIASSAHAIIVGPGGFGPYGEAGYAYGYPVALHGVDTTDGDVNQLDAFLYLDSNGDGTPDDLNGGYNGVTAQLSYDPLPSGLGYGFGYSLSADATDLFLTYTLTNNTGSALSDMRFLSYLDAEIVETYNSFYNEYGGTTGTPGSGAGDANPDSWEIDDPVDGDINTWHLYDGILDNTNAVPGTSPSDVAMALGFNLGILNPLDVATIQILISTDGAYLGSLALHQYDTLNANNITFSGQSSVSGSQPVPEPGTLLLMGAGMAAMAAWRVRRRV